MKKYQTIQDQFNRLQKCEKNLYQAIQYRQKQLQANLQNHVNKYNCQIKRKTQISQKNYPQQIKHPNNNGIYIYLGNCIQQLEVTDLDDIKTRQQQRRKQRQRIQQLKTLQETGKQIFQSEEKEIQKIKNNEIKQVPWKLMRKIRQKQVQQNKKIIQKRNENKKQRMAQNLNLNMY